MSRSDWQRATPELIQQVLLEAKGKKGTDAEASLSWTADSKEIFFTSSRGSQVVAILGRIGSLVTQVQRVWHGGEVTEWGIAVPVSCFRGFDYAFKRVDNKSAPGSFWADLRPPSADVADADDE